MNSSAANLGTVKCLSFLTALLAGCGGGGGDAGSPAPPPPPAPAACVASPPPPAPAPGANPPQVRLTMSNGAGVSGDVVLTLNPAQAPVTTANFLSYVNAGFYNCTVFHRHSRDFVMQGGGFAGPVTSTTAFSALKATNPPIALEVGRGLSNVRLTVAMARTDLNTATSQFFINLVDNVFLDTSAGGYAVFGSVTAGADVVTAMRAAPCTSSIVSGSDCLPVPNITITSAVQTR